MKSYIIILVTVGMGLVLAVDAVPEHPWRWKPEDFGHGMKPDEIAGKKVIANYRSALERLRIRAPPLPDDLKVLWDDFIEEFPDYWLQTNKTHLVSSAALKFLDTLKKIIEALGKHCLEDPGTKAKPRGKDGDPNVWAARVRQSIKDMEGCSTKKLKL